MNKAIKIRIYPTKEQQAWLMKNFGCCRFVYNFFLDVRKAAYDCFGMSFNYTENAADLTELKDEYEWLREADSASLQQALRHLDTAYKNFFNETARFPKYKSKRKSRFSYTTPMNNGKITVGNGYIKLPKTGKIKAKIHRQPGDGWKILSATVSMERDGTYYASVLYEYEPVIVPVSRPEDNAVGLDYMSDGLYQSSDGVVCGSPKYFRKSQKKLAKEQKKLSRKVGQRQGEQQSNNFKKQSKMVNKIHRKIANQRNDFLQKESTKIANSYDLVCIEDLDMKAMSNKGFGNGKATMDNGWGMFTRMLKYKLEDRGKVLVKVDKWYPSSQLCSACGHRNHDTKDLAITKWVCPHCGTYHDRNENAAYNILGEGLRVLQKGA